MNRIKEEILLSVRNRIYAEEIIDDERALEIISEEVFEDQRLSGEDMKKLRDICMEIFYKTRSRLGILKPLADDPSVTEIMVNGAGGVNAEYGFGGTQGNK